MLPGGRGGTIRNPQLVARVSVGALVLPPDLLRLRHRGAGGRLPGPHWLTHEKFLPAVVRAALVPHRQRGVYRKRFRLYTRPSCKLRHVRVTENAESPALHSKTTSPVKVTVHLRLIRNRLPSVIALAPWYAVTVVAMNSTSPIVCVELETDPKSTHPCKTRHHLCKLCNLQGGVSTCSKGHVHFHRHDFVRRKNAPLASRNACILPRLCATFTYE